VESTAAAQPVPALFDVLRRAVTMQKLELRGDAVFVTDFMYGGDR
jgi:hypothetical protein